MTPLRRNANKMKNFLRIITGVVAGSALAVALILQSGQVAFSAINWWDEVVSFGDAFDWKNVFSPSSSGQNLYALVHAKLFRYPQNDALNEIARNYGLSRNEARSVVNGSMTPLFNTNALKNNVTQEDAFVAMKGMQEQYKLLLEVYDLQQEVDIYTTPTEMFANNDLSDSGFDLIHDLSVIEEILFVDIVQNTVGKPLSEQLDKPYLPTDLQKTLPPYIANKNPAAIAEFTAALSDDGGASGGGVSGVKNEKSGEALAVENGEIAAQSGSLTIGEYSVPVEIKENDICPADENSFAGTLQDFNEDQAAVSFGNGGSGVANSSAQGGQGGGVGISGNGTDGSAGGSDGAISGGAGGEKAKTPIKKENGLLSPEADKWKSEWCPGLSSGEPAGDDSGNALGKNSFKSLGGVNYLVDLIAKQSAGAVKAFGNEDIAAYIAVCFDVELVTKTVSSYDPGKGCVLCEAEQINELMTKTLSASLVPNKAVGNFFETAKCKDAYEPFLDMQFIAIAAPIPSPSNDDAIYGKNIFEEWNNFVERYQPLLLPKIEGDFGFNVANLPADTSQAELLRSLTKTVNKSKADAQLMIENFERTADSTNVVGYMQAVLTELNEMRVFFEKYNDLYKKTAKVCKETGKKKSLD